MRVPVEADRALLYALAKAPLHRDELPLWHYGPGQEAWDLALFLHPVQSFIRAGLLYADEVVSLAAHLRCGEAYHREKFAYFFQEGVLNCKVDVEPWPRRYTLPPVMLAQTLEEVVRRYKSAQGQGVSVEKGLATFLGATPFAKRTALESLARTQSISNPEVSACWWIIEEAIDFRDFEVELLENLVHSDSGGRSGEFSISFQDGVQARVAFVMEECFCPAREMLGELQTLLRRFYESI